jgi:integrase
MAFRTQAQVDKLRLPPGKSEVYHFDEDCTGLSVRIQGSARSWVVWYQANGRRRRMKIGDVGDAMSLKDARIKAGGIVNGARDGKDALAERERTKAKAAETFGALVATYLARGAKPRQRPRTYAETERYLDRYCADLHGHPVDALTRRDVAGKLEAIRDAHGPGAARKARIYISGCYSWAMRRGLVDANPVIGTEAEPERPRDRVLTVNELRAVWQPCDGLGDFGAVVKLLMLTGQRRTEVAGLAWAEIDLDKALWTLPAERSKNGRQHEVPLPTQALALIQAQRKEEDRAKRPYLFGRDGRNPFSGYSRAKARLDARIAEQQAERRLGRKLRKGEAPEPGDSLEAWNLHDIRRSTVTHMAELGIDPHVIEAVVNHVSGHKGGIAGVYNKASYRPQKAAALQSWADWLEAKVEDREPASNIVALAG